jgi:hypothetical protein
VADRCPTPLAVCKFYAKTRGLSINTLKLDFSNSVLPHRYDVVYGDCILQFVPQQFHVDVLRKLGQAMTKRSTLILVERLRASGAYGSRSRERAVETLNALAARGIRLPEDEAGFLLRLTSMLNAHRARITEYPDQSNLSSYLAAAGFRLRELSDADREQTDVLPNGETVAIKITVAFPMRD